MRNTEFLPSSLDLLAEGILIADAEPLDGAGPKIIYVNRAMETMTGYRSDELIGQTPRIMQCEETERPVLDRIGSALQAGMPITETLENAKKDGSKYFAELKIVPERDETGRIIRFISIQRDVTTTIREQERLQAQEASFRLLFDENPTAMFVVARKTLKILKVNETWERVYGYDRETALSLSSNDLRPDIPHEILARDILEEASTGRLAGPYQVVGANGKRFPAMTMRRLIDFEGQEAIISVLWDVSEIESARAQVRDSLTQLEQLTAKLVVRTKELSDAHRLAKVGSWYWDFRQRTVLFAPEVWLIMGRPNPELPVSYDQMRELFHPDDYQKAMDIYYRAAKERIAATAEYRIIHPDGTIRELLSYAEPAFDDENNNVVGLRGTSQDITEFRAVEAQLRASEDHYRNMVDLHPQIPWTASPDGGILEAGAKWSQLTGMLPSETFPHGWVKAVHPDDITRVLAEWKSSLTSLMPLDTEFRICHKDGNFLWVRVRAAVRVDGQGQPLRW
jgi:PAS domain S-box-containing protein